MLTLSRERANFWRSHSHLYFDNVAEAVPLAGDDPTVEVVTMRRCTTIGKRLAIVKRPPRVEKGRIFLPVGLDTPKYVVPPQVPPLVALALIVILDRVAPAPFVPRAVSFGIGIPLLVLGVGFWIRGVSGLLRSGESPNPTKATARLVTSGPYRFSRNPIYTGGTVGLFGLALLLDTATGVAVVAALALTAYNLILPEERYLEARFGDEWRDYRSRVRRWI